MVGKFFFIVKDVSSVTQGDWQLALFKVLVNIDRIFDGDKLDAFIQLYTDADWAFLFCDKYASWSDGKPKSFDILYRWGKDAIKGKLGGCSRGDWSIVQRVCQ